MKNICLCKIYLVLLVIFSPSVFAGWQSGKITGYIPYSVDNKEVLIFRIVNNVGGGCNNTTRFAISDDNIRYQSTFAAILTAFSSNKMIRVNYTESCNAWGNSWDANFICVGDIPC
ncbi:hypothetical protein M3P05_12485 [Sansalvadorimonas sp. 2012CJ34-2]|uniref:Uncharacterized protein n=1 Tax=Parendozoicomonas callyspongiae TaxID=2942213 RepID=A0ABT0PHK7_9GAMM|nr:hypothetical protein [Sansalvadorimonas sp. 2012CJ34-2]MCL6270741.1 hypothetical protein [Sansalvadorimonas sp. 2012CJ34-2]